MCWIHFYVSCKILNLKGSQHAMSYVGSLIQEHTPHVFVHYV